MPNSLLALFESEPDEGPPNNPHQIKVSTDNGQTWTDQANLVVLDGIYGMVEEGTKLGTADGDVYYPDGGPMIDTAFYPYAVIARTQDLGTSWAGVVSSAVFDVAGGDNWVTHGFLRVSSLVRLAFGLYVVGSTHYHMLRSTDGGGSWALDVSLSPAAGDPGSYELFNGLLTSSGTILAGGGNNFAGQPTLWRSTNGGLSYTEISLPTLNFTSGQLYLILAFADLGGGVLLAGGQAVENVGGTRPPRLWRSTDDGASWTEITAGVGGMTYGAGDTVHDVTDLAFLGNERVALLMEANPSVATQFARLSNDNGLTFTVVGTYSPAATGTGASKSGQMAVADDGSLTVTRSVDSLNYEIWRGVPSSDYSACAWTRKAAFAPPSGTSCGNNGVVLVGEVSAPPPPPPPPPTDVSGPNLPPGTNILLVASMTTQRWAIAP